MEERGFDTAVTALGVYELLREAAEVLPGILELEIDEAFAGLRPGTPDNAPIARRRSGRRTDRLGDRALPQWHPALPADRRTRRR